MKTSRNSSRNSKSKRRILNNLRSDRHRETEDLDFTVVTALTVDQSLDRSTARITNDRSKKGHILNFLNNNNNTRNEHSVINHKVSKTSKCPSRQSAKMAERMSKYACYTDPKGDGVVVNKVEKCNSTGSTKKFKKWIIKAKEEFKVGFNMHNKGLNPKHKPNILNCFNRKSAEGDCPQDYESNIKDQFDEEDFTTVTTEYSKLNSYSKSCSTFSYNQNNLSKKIKGNRKMLETLTEQCTHLSRSIRSLRDELNKAEGSLKKSGKYTKTSNASTSQSLDSLTSLNKIIIDEDIWEMGKMNDSVKKIANDCVSSNTKSYSRKTKTPVEQSFNRANFDSPSKIEQKACVILFQKNGGDVSKSSDHDGSWNICGMEEVDANLMNVIKSMSNKSHSGGNSIKSSNSKKNGSTRASKSSPNCMESDESYSEVKTVTVTTETRTAKSKPKTEKSYPTKSKSKSRFSAISEVASNSAVSERSDWPQSWNNRPSRSVSPSNRSYTSGASAGTFAEAPSPNFDSADVYNNEVVHLIDYAAYNTNRNNSSSSNADDEQSHTTKAISKKKCHTLLSKLGKPKKVRLRSLANIRTGEILDLINYIKNNYSNVLSTQSILDEIRSQDSSTLFEGKQREKRESSNCSPVDSMTLFSNNCSTESQYYTSPLTFNTNNNSLDEPETSKSFKLGDNQGKKLNPKRLFYDKILERNDEFHCLDSNQNNDTRKTNQENKSYRAAAQEKIFGLSRENKAILEELERHQEEEEEETEEEEEEDFREQVNKVKEEKQKRMEEEHRITEQLTREAIMAQIASRHQHPNPIYNSSQVSKTVFNTKQTLIKPSKTENPNTPTKSQKAQTPERHQHQHAEQEIPIHATKNKSINEYYTAERMRIQNTSNSNQENNDSFHLPPSYKAFIQNKQRELKEKEDKAAAEKAAAALIQETTGQNFMPKISQERPHMAATLVDTTRIINYMHEINLKLDAIGRVVEDLARKVILFEQGHSNTKFPDDEHILPTDYRLFESGRGQHLSPHSRYTNNSMNESFAFRDSTHINTQQPITPSSSYNQQTFNRLGEQQCNPQLMQAKKAEEALVRQKSIHGPVCNSEGYMMSQGPVDPRMIEAHLPAERQVPFNNHFHQRVHHQVSPMNMSETHINQSHFSQNIIQNPQMLSVGPNLRNHGRSLTKTISDMNVDRNIVVQKPVPPTNAVAYQRQQAMINLEQRRLLALHQQQQASGGVVNQSNTHLAGSDRPYSQMSLRSREENNHILNQ